MRKSGPSSSVWPIEQLRSTVYWLSSALGIDPSLLLHSLFLLGTTVFGQLISFAVQILVANLTGVEVYGIYSYLWTWVSLLALVAVMGNDRLIIRYGSEYLALNQPGQLRDLIRWSCGWSLAVAILLAIGFVAARLALSEPTPGRLPIALWAASAIPLLVAASFVENGLRVYGAHVWANLPTRLFRPLLMGMLFYLPTLVITTTLDARWVILSNTLAILFSLVIAVAALGPRLPRKIDEYSKVPRRPWVSTSLAFGINALALHLNMTLDMLVLGVFWDDDVLGIYGAVMRFGAMMAFASSTVVTIIQPMIVRAVNVSGKLEMQRLISGGSRIVFLVATGICLPIFIFAESLLRIFGPGFEGGAGALRIMLLGALIGSMISLAGSLLGMTGNERQATAVMVAGCVLNLALNVLLIPSLGIIGAATATSLSLVVWNLALFGLAWRRVGIIAAPFNLRSGSGGPP